MSTGGSYSLGNTGGVTLSMGSPAGVGFGPIGIADLGSHSHQFDGMDIRITVANNGTIISVKREGYGNKPDLYLVHEDQDLGQEIGKIITMSCLKKE